MGEKFFTAHTEGDEARVRLVKASKKIADAIKSTLGPNGWHVALERNEGHTTPTVTKDGATVMHDLLFEDKWESMMYEMYRDASDHVSKVVGDGTTSVVILADAMLQTGFRAYAAGYDVADVITGMRETAAQLLEMVEENCLHKKITEEVIRAVLNVASSKDESITDRLTDIFLDSGDSGMIIVKDSTISEDSHVFEEGYVIAISTKNIELFEGKEGEAPKAIINWTNPYVLVVNDHIKEFKSIVPIMEQVLLHGETKKLLVLYTRMEDDIVESIRTNNMSDKNDLQIMTVRMPMYAERQVKLQEDFAAFAGARVADKIYTSVGVETFGLSDLGRVDHMSASRYEIKVTGGDGAKNVMESGKTFLQERIELVEADRNFYTGNIQERNDANYRLARLKSSICCVYPGGHSQAEAKRRKAVYEDCIRAVQSAVLEGVVPGGGWPMYLMSCNLESEAESWRSSKNFGASVIVKAVQVLFRKLSEDIDMPAELVAQKIASASDDLPRAAFNFATKEAGDAVKLGVLEPFYLTKEILNQAVSIATTILTSDGTVTRHSTKWYKPWKQKMQSMEHLKY